MNKQAIIEFQDFSFQYYSQAEPTLHDINLKIYPGEKILIVGPSGSGKSTLGHCLNGLIPFSYKGEMKGSLKINGQATCNLDIFTLSKMVGTVLQDSDGQFVGLTVGEDIAFALENDNIPHGEMHERVEKVSRMVDMQDWLGSSPFELSGGQKQRTSLAGVLIDDVDILLFDEPLANLDPATGKTAIEIIDDIHKQSKKTIIIIEHRLEDVLHRDIDRVIVINDGRIIADMDAACAGCLPHPEGNRHPRTAVCHRPEICRGKGHPGDAAGTHQHPEDGVFRVTPCKPGSAGSIIRSPENTNPCHVENGKYLLFLRWRPPHPGRYQL